MKTFKRVLQLVLVAALFCTQVVGINTVGVYAADSAGTEKLQILADFRAQSNGKIVDVTGNMADLSGSTMSTTFTDANFGKDYSDYAMNLQSAGATMTDKDDIQTIFSQPVTIWMRFEFTVDRSVTGGDRNIFDFDDYLATLAYNGGGPGFLYVMSGRSNNNAFGEARYDISPTKGDVLEMAISLNKPLDGTKNSFTVYNGGMNLGTNETGTSAALKPKAQETRQLQFFKSGGAIVDRIVILAGDFTNADAQDPPFIRNTRVTKKSEGAALRNLTFDYYGDGGPYITIPKRDNPTYGDLINSIAVGCPTATTRYVRDGVAIKPAADDLVQNGDVFEVSRADRMVTPDGDIYPPGKEPLVTSYTIKLLQSTVNTMEVVSADGSFYMEGDAVYASTGASLQDFISSITVDSMATFEVEYEGTKYTAAEAAGILLDTGASLKVVVTPEDVTAVKEYPVSIIAFSNDASFTVRNITKNDTAKTLTVSSNDVGITVRDFMARTIIADYATSKVVKTDNRTTAKDADVIQNGYSFVVTSQDRSVSNKYTFVVPAIPEGVMVSDKNIEMYLEDGVATFDFDAWVVPAEAEEDIAFVGYNRNVMTISPSGDGKYTISATGEGACTVMAAAGDVYTNFNVVIRDLDPTQAQVVLDKNNAQLTDSVTSATVRVTTYPTDNAQFTVTIADESVAKVSSVADDRFTVEAVANGATNATVSLASDPTVKTVLPIYVGTSGIVAPSNIAKDTPDIPSDFAISDADYAKITKANFEVGDESTYPDMTQPLAVEQLNPYWTYGVDGADGFKPMNTTSFVEKYTAVTNDGGSIIDWTANYGSNIVMMSEYGDVVTIGQTKATNNNAIITLNDNAYSFVMKFTAPADGTIAIANAPIGSKVYHGEELVEGTALNAVDVVAGDEILFVVSTTSTTPVTATGFPIILYADKPATIVYPEDMSYINVVDADGAVVQLVEVAQGASVSVTAQSSMTDTLTWVSSDEDVAVVNSDGTITGKTAGTVKVDVCVGDVSYYTFEVTVLPNDVVVKETTPVTLSRAGDLAGVVEATNNTDEDKTVTVIVTYLRDGRIMLNTSHVVEIDVDANGTASVDLSEADEIPDGANGVKVMFWSTLEDMATVDTAITID